MSGTTWYSAPEEPQPPQRQPQSRLHMPMNRNNRDRDLRRRLTLAAPEGARRPGRGVTPPDCRPLPSYVGPMEDSRSQPTFPSLQPGRGALPQPEDCPASPAFLHGPATPAELANTPWMLPSLPLLSRPSRNSWLKRHLTPVCPEEIPQVQYAHQNRRRPWRQQTRRAASELWRRHAPAGETSEDEPETCSPQSGGAPGGAAHASRELREASP